MTKIIYFVTPSSLIQISEKVVDFIQVIGSGAEFIKTSRKITEISDPITISSKGIGLLVNYCFGKTGALFVITVFYGLPGNVGMISTGTKLGIMILEQIFQ